ncbi:MAG: right-handed parallel beta-helix repeat-containing protein [Sporocytophaga sp.]|uniref:right-handed parallel beta-helix repeat-containing protein n=1 Tax=Sporocytophaga sp. TaxID=2231183 RepID=UPI001B12C210|nr:right-handed parallel beta-helix repeat-containing protein [Sporocytophaga sp.]MBO9703745.1 right-handed parallel beta-helix repeat-containing protein [Sporocytophaga sp.]
MIIRLILLLTFISIFGQFNFEEPSCHCDFTLAPETEQMNGFKTLVKPGDVICIMAGKRKNLQLINIQGDSINPVKVINCGGRVEVSNMVLGYGIKLDNCQYIKLTGTGDDKIEYGFLIDSTKKGAMGVMVGKGSSDFEIDHLEIKHSGFAGIMAKTDPECDGSYTRGTFIQKNVFIHHNYIHHVKGEGLYVGNSFYTGWNGNKKCPDTLLFPHELKNIKIYDNKIENTQWDGIQLGCAVSKSEIYNNTIDSFGLANIGSQRNGIQVGLGTTGLVYNNRVLNGKGNGIIVLGIGDNIIYNNLISDCSEFGIFCDNREVRDSSKIILINNSILNPKMQGIKMSNELTDNYILNNVIIRTGEPGDKKDYFISFGDKAAARTEGNYTSNKKSLIKPLLENRFVSDVVQKGKHQDVFSVDKDINGKARRKSGSPDPGCIEF